MGVSALILSAGGGAQAQKLTSAGTAILDAGNGSVVVSGDGVHSGCINWSSGVTPPAACTNPPTPGSGTLTVDPGSTAPFTSGETGTIQDLSFQTTYPLVDFVAIGGLDFFDLLDVRFNSGNSAIGECSVATGDTMGGASRALQPILPSHSLTVLPAAVASIALLSISQWMRRATWPVPARIIVRRILILESSQLNKRFRV